MQVRIKYLENSPKDMGFLVSSGLLRPKSTFFLQIVACGFLPEKLVSYDKQEQDYKQKNGFYDCWFFNFYNTPSNEDESSQKQ